MVKKDKMESIHVIKRYLFYSYIRFIRYIINSFYQRKKHYFLFILSPPYCGSTMLNQLLSSSRNVSCNNHLGTREGQLLPGVSHIMFQDNRWDEEIHYPWEDIKTVWMRYWDLSKKVLLDKSIPNIMRVAQIDKVFDPIYYICMVRNPYAQVESIIRRNQQDVRSAAEFAIKCLYFQSINKDRKNTFFFTYEELCNDTDKVIKRMIDFLPDLEDINANMGFTSHNYKTSKKMRMMNLNDEKIAKLSDADILTINSVFEGEKDILRMFNYKIIQR